MRDRFEKLESLTNALKNVAVLIGSVALIVFLWPSIKAVVSEERSIESFGAFGVEVSLTEAVNKAAPQEGISDEPVPEPVARAAEKIEVGGQLWSFVGTFRDGYIKPNFDVDDVPETGDSIVAVRDIYRRAREPKFTVTGWKMGEIEGLIKSGQTLKVTTIERVPAAGGGFQDWVRGLIVE